MSKKNFIINFFKGLEEHEIEYCILRNYENLPYSVGRDIDILIKNNNEKNDLIKNNIESLISKLGWEYIYTQDIDGLFTLTCYLIDGDNVEVVQLDLWSELRWRGLCWIDNNEILNRRIKKNGFFVASKGCEVVVTALKELMGGKKVPFKYYNRIINYCKEDKEGFISCLKPIYKDFCNEIYECCLNGDFNKLNSLNKKIKRKLKYKSFNSYTRYFKFSINRLLIKFKGFIKPKGMLIAFVGPDGSGKTTIIDKENELLSPFFSFTKKFHIRFGIFPELKTGFGFSSMKGKINKGEIDMKNANAKKKYTNKEKGQGKRTLVSILASWFVVLYYLIEFIIGGMITKRIVINNGLILYDRYFYDFFVQPTTRDLIMPYKKVLLSFVTKPDIIIHLNADPHVVYSRKKELKVNEIEIQNLTMNKALGSLKMYHKINTDIKNPQTISVEAFRIIINELKRR